MLALAGFLLTVEGVLALALLATLYLGTGFAPILGLAACELIFVFWTGTLLYSAYGTP